MSLDGNAPNTNEAGNETDKKKNGTMKGMVRWFRDAVKRKASYITGVFASISAPAPTPAPVPVVDKTMELHQD